MKTQLRRVGKRFRLVVPEVEPMADYGFFGPDSVTWKVWGHTTTLRDAKIDSLYEGTTAIQAQDFFFRKIARDQGGALAHIAGQIQAFIDSDVAAAQFFAANVLPEITATRGILARTSTALMDLDDDAF
jgi:hypothetical protein